METRTEHLGKITLINADCMDVMKSMPDKTYDLVIADPPYGLGLRTVDGGGTNAQTRFKDDLRNKRWDDKIPSDEYFSEIKRISVNQIIWGGNYFNLSKYRCFIVWDKMVYIPSMSQVELAYTSFDSPARYFRYPSRDKLRFHPTQKPVALYAWLLNNFAKQGDRILDTHLGSGSSAIAAHELGFEFTGIEIDEDYFNKAVARIKQHQRQLLLF